MQTIILIIVLIILILYVLRTTKEQFVIKKYTRPLIRKVKRFFTIK